MFDKLTTELRGNLHALEASADKETYLRLLQDLIRTAKKYERILKKEQ